MKLVFASNNAHKLLEVREIMPAGIEVLSLSEIGFEKEIAETGSTLAENSLIKARTVYQWLQDRMVNEPMVNDQIVNVLGVFADDTGLEIDALNGEPGVYTARWYKVESGKSKDRFAQSRKSKDKETKDELSEQEIFKANRAKALRELQGKEDRGAQFKTVITLIRKPTPSLPKGKEVIQVEGVVRGHITEDERGTSGFGYDPIFIPDGHDKTFGELPAEVKNSISHRARATAALVRELSK